MTLMLRRASKCEEKHDAPLSLLKNHYHVMLDWAHRFYTYQLVKGQEAESLIGMGNLGDLFFFYVWCAASKH
jgi:hypothetical protein